MDSVLETKQNEMEQQNVRQVPHREKWEMRKALLEQNTAGHQYEKSRQER